MLSVAAQIVATLDGRVPAIWVCISSARGSVPREAGAHMVVMADALAGTIGGGHLELERIPFRLEGVIANALLPVERNAAEKGIDLASL